MFFSLKIQKNEKKKQCFFTPTHLQRDVVGKNVGSVGSFRLVKFIRSLRALLYQIGNTLRVMAARSRMGVEIESPFPKNSQCFLFGDGKINLRDFIYPVFKDSLGIRLDDQSEFPFLGDFWSRQISLGTFETLWTLPETNQNTPENRARLPQTVIIFQPFIFRGYISFRE